MKAFTEEQVAARLVILDKLAAVILSTHEDGDSASDYQQKMWKAIEILSPLLEPRDIPAPADGTVESVDAYPGANIAEWQANDPMARIGSVDVTLGKMGRIDDVLVKKGADVKKGQVLFRFREYIPCR